MLELIVPLKDLHRAKARLGSALGPAARRELVRAMAEDLLAVAAAQPFVHRIHVILGTDWDAAALDAPFVNLIGESTLDSRDLNTLLHSAIAAIRPSRGLLLHGDLPCLTAQDLMAVDEALNATDLLLCPDARYRGTNAVAFNSGREPALRFGEDSFQAHMREAERVQGDWRTLTTVGLSRDIDLPSDLHWLAGRATTGQWVGQHTRAWFAQHWTPRAVSPRGHAAGLDSAGARS